VLPAETTAAIGTRPGGTRSFWLAGFYYLIAAMAVTMWLWRDLASRIVAANPTDSDQFAWFFRYAATAVAHLRLPALTTAGMNAPQGINLMWNTPMPLLGVLLAPLTLLAGPQASITAAITLGFAGSALALFAVLRRWNAGVLAAAAGGLGYGFSPALIASARGHYDLQFAVLPPLIADAALRLATGRRGTWRWPALRFEIGRWAALRFETGRWPALRRGSWLGLLVAAKIFISEELLLDAGIAAVIALVVLAVSRPRAALGRVGDVLAGTAAGFVVAVLIAGYGLYEQFLGPLRQRGSPFTPDFYKNDLAGFVQPSAAMLAHARASAAFAAAFQGGSPEYLAYLGWPMLLVLAAVAVLFWRVPTVRVAAVVFVVLASLSLGGTLLAGGHEHAWAKLPWYWLQSAPVAGSAIPDQFSILADGAAAALFAFGLDAARARWADARPSAGWTRRSRRCGCRPARAFSCCPFRCRRSPSRCGGRQTPGNRPPWSAVTSWGPTATARRKPTAAACRPRACTLTGCGCGQRRAAPLRATPPRAPQSRPPRCRLGRRCARRSRSGTPPRSPPSPPATRPSAGTSPACLGRRPSASARFSAGACELPD
jgi:hypothetical protein